MHVSRKIIAAVATLAVGTILAGCKADKDRAVVTTSVESIADDILFPGGKAETVTVSVVATSMSAAHSAVLIKLDCWETDGGSSTMKTIINFDRGTSVGRGTVVFHTRRACNPRATVVEMI